MDGMGRYVAGNTYDERIIRYRSGPAGAPAG